MHGIQNLKEHLSTSGTMYSRQLSALSSYPLLSGLSASGSTCWVDQLSCLLLCPDLNPPRPEAFLSHRFASYLLLPENSILLSNPRIFLPKCLCVSCFHCLGNNSRSVSNTKYVISHSTTDGLSDQKLSVHWPISNSITFCRTFWSGYFITLFMSWARNFLELKVISEMESSSLGKANVSHSWHPLPAAH